MLQTIGKENLVLYGKDGKKYVVTEIYQNTVSSPIAAVYYTNNSTPICIWKRIDAYVPFDYTTCTLVLTNNIDKSKVDINIYRDYGKETQYEITTSLKEFNLNVTYTNDIIPETLYLVTDTTVPNETIFVVDEISLKTIADDTKGTYNISVDKAVSHAGGTYLPDPSGEPVSTEITLPYTLTMDEDNSEIWFIVKPTVDMSFTQITAPAELVGQGAGSIYIMHETGILGFKAEYNGIVPSYEDITIGTETYHYLLFDFSTASSKSGNPHLKADNTYYIRLMWTPWSTDVHNHYYYRNGGIIGTVGYSLTSLVPPGQAFDLSLYTYKGTITTEDALVQLKANEYAYYKTDTQYKIQTNNVYLAKTSLNYGGSTSNIATICKETDSTKIYWYTGSSIGSIYPNNYFTCSSPLEIEETNNAVTFFNYDADTLVSWTGEGVGNSWEYVLKPNGLYKIIQSCPTFVGDFTTHVSSGLPTGAPTYDEVEEGDVFFAADWYTHGWQQLNGFGLYQLTTKGTSTSDSTLTSLKISDYFIEATDVIGYTLVNASNTVTSNFTNMERRDMTEMVINTDKKYEFKLT